MSVPLLDNSLYGCGLCKSKLTVQGAPMTSETPVTHFDSIQSIAQDIRHHEPPMPKPQKQKATRYVHSEFSPKKKWNA